MLLQLPSAPYDSQGRRLGSMTNSRREAKPAGVQSLSVIDARPLLEAMYPPDADESDKAACILKLLQIGLLSGGDDTCGATDYRE